jgi:hypothetical protein
MERGGFLVNSQKEEILDKLANICVMNPQYNFSNIISLVGISNCVMSDSDVIENIDRLMHGQIVSRMKQSLGNRYRDITGTEFTNKVMTTPLKDLTEEDLIIAFNQDAWIKISQGQMPWNWTMFMEFLKGFDFNSEG